MHGHGIGSVGVEVYVGYKIAHSTIKHTSYPKKRSAITPIPHSSCFFVLHTYLIALTSDEDGGVRGMDASDFNIGK